MKKTIVGIMTIVAMLVAILGTNVNAATVSVNATEVKEGETVTVTVTTNNPMKAVQYDIAYNPEYLELVSGATKVGDVAKVSEFVKTTTDTIPSTTVTFKALKDTDATKLTISNEGFSEDGLNPGTETIENDKEYSVKIGVGTEKPDPTATPEPTAEPTAEPTGTTAPTATPNNDKIKYPQTGAPVYAYVAGIALVVIVAGAVLAVRKNK